MINSHTTYLTCMGVIDVLNLPRKDILLILVRNYKNTLMRGYEFIDASEICLKSEQVFDKKFDRSCVRAMVEEVDRFICRNIEGTFHLYAPHLSHPFWQIVYTSKSCFSFSYVQEGCLPFKNAYVNKAPFLAKLKNIYMAYVSKGRVWCYRPWFLREKIIDINKIDSYSIDDNFFKYLPVRNTLVKWPTPSDMPTVSFKSNHKIFIFDAFVKNHIMESVDYLLQCELLIDKEASDYNYLKFHPGQTPQEKMQILMIFEKRNLKYIILDNNIPFEYIIMTQKNLALTGYGSSLLFLAYSYLHKVTCYDDELLKYPLYQRYKRCSGFMSFKEYTGKK